MTEWFNNYFMSVFTKKSMEFIPIPEQMFKGQEDSILEDIRIDEAVVLKKLSLLRVDKASGPGELSLKILKELMDIKDGIHSQLSFAKHWMMDR